MALLKFEPPKELAPLRVKIARPVHERVERYQQFCGALELADLVERALVYVMDHDADFRAHEKVTVTARMPTGPLRFCVTPDALLRRAGKCMHTKDIRRLHPIALGEYGYYG
jgi:hypothetical protein